MMLSGIGLLVMCAFLYPVVWWIVGGMVACYVARKLLSRYDIVWR